MNHEWTDHFLFGGHFVRDCWREKICVLVQERVNNDVTRRNTDSIKVDLLGYLWKREDETTTGAGGASFGFLRIAWLRTCQLTP